MHSDTAFHNAFLLAAFLHVAGLVVFTLPEWEAPPAPEVSTLKIKLQPKENTAALAALEPASGTPQALPGPPPLPAPAKPSAFSHTVKPAAPAQEPKKTLPKPPIRKPVALLPAKKTAVSLPGNSIEKEAEALQRYEQLLGLWFEEHYYYPMEARDANHQGDAVVWISIDRSGRILHAEFEKHTGDALLDEAVMVMVQKANPVPKLPTDYPAGKSFEFFIPISFRID